MTDQYHKMVMICEFKTAFDSSDLKERINTIFEDFAPARLGELATHSEIPVGFKCKPILALL